MVHYLQSHSRVVAFFLCILFCFFMFFSFSTLQAEASVVALVGGVLLFGALLTTMGVTFASTQDLEVAYNGFMADESYAYYNEAHSVVAQATAGYLANGVLDFADNWSDGWNYFVEHVSQYFGFETGVVPNIPIPSGMTQLFIDNAVVPGGLSVTQLAGASNAVGDMTQEVFDSVSNINFPYDASKFYNGQFKYWETVGSSKILPYIHCPTTITVGSSSISFGYAFDSYGLTMLVSHDSWNTCNNYGLGYGSYVADCIKNGNYNSGAIQIEYLGNNVKLYFLHQFKSRLAHTYSRDLFYDSSVTDTAGRWGDISICPDVTLPGDDAKYKWQDVVGTLAEMKEALQHITWDMEGILSQVGVMTDGVLTGLKDWTLTQSDVIPDALAKELDKTIPTPPPQPTSSPKPSPGPSTPPGNLPIGPLPPDITRKFPFCLPFDLIKIVEVLNAEPKAPHFEIPIQMQSAGIDEKIVVDLAEFEPYIKYFRIFVILDFVILLIFISRKMTGS